MAGEIFETLWRFVEAGQYGQALTYTFNNYFPYASIIWLFGFAIFAIIYKKTRNLVWAGLPTSAYFLILSSTPYITSIYVRMAMRYFGIILGVIVGYYVYRMMKGG